MCVHHFPVVYRIVIKAAIAESEHHDLVGVETIYD